MEISSFRSLPELGMDDPLFSPQWPLNSLEDLTSASNASLFYEDLLHSFSQQPAFDLKRAPDSSPAGAVRPLKRLNSPSSSSIQFLSSNFSDPVGVLKPKEETWSSSNSTRNFPSESVFSQSNQNFILKPCQGTKRISTNTRLAQAVPDHILAERKRRENLSQRFIALSAIVPGLKKVDKASVLGEAIRYMKQLQEKVKILEEQSKKRSMESVVFVKKCELYADGEISSSNESLSFGSIVSEPLPEIEARFCDKDVLIIIHCERRKGVVEKAVAAIEKLHLSVGNSCVMTFGDSALNITVVARKDEKFTMDVKELVKNLRDAFKVFM